jgi:general secretion pathway protein K
MQLVNVPTKSRRRLGRNKRSARGVALIFVLTTIAILTAIGVDFSYQSRVNFELAIQSRDSVRARAIAMSGMNMGRLLLHFQGMLDQATATMGASIVNMVLALLPGMDPKPLEELCTVAGLNAQGCLKSLSAKMQAPAGAAAPPAASGAASIQLWKLADNFDGNTIFNFLNAFPTPAEKRNGSASPSFGIDANGAEPIEASFGEFAGTFDVKVSDEDQKINVTRLYGSDVGGVSLSAVLQLKPLLENPAYNFLFDEEDRNHEKVPRNDIITALRDWVDDDDQQTAFDPTMLSGSPFAPGAGDENGAYSRYKPRYKAKNARFDSVDELRMVHGINDNFMLAFGDKLTVYPDVNSKLNVNTADPVQLWSDIYAMAKDPRDPILQNPLLPSIVQMEINYRKHMLPFIGITAPDFVAMLEADGIVVNPALKNPSSNQNIWGSTSSTFRMVSTGHVGRVKKTLTAVVRYDAGMGQLLYWHEE